MDYRIAVQQLMQDPRYKKNIEYGVPRQGHPEGPVKNHIADLEKNLERFKPRLGTEEEYWKLKFLIHVHDTFKAESGMGGVSATDLRSHEILAREFASEFTEETQADPGGCILGSA